MCHSYDVIIIKVLFPMVKMMKIDQEMRELQSKIKRHFFRIIRFVRYELVEILCRLESEADLVEEKSANALNASEEAHRLAKLATGSTTQVTQKIRLLEQRCVVYYCSLSDNCSSSFTQMSLYRDAVIFVYFGQVKEFVFLTRHINTKSDFTTY